MSSEDRGAFLLLGIGALTAAGWWLVSRKAKAREPYRSSECSVAATGLCLSSDCQTVEFEQEKFTDGLVVQFIREEVNKGDAYPVRGIPFLNSNKTVLDHSADRLTREVLAEFYPKHCYEGKTFWVDQYIAKNPMPKPTSSSRTAYYDRLLDYTMKMVSAAQEAMKTRKAAAEVAGRIFGTCAAAYTSRIDIPPRGGLGVGPSEVLSARPDLVTRLVDLGYSVDESDAWHSLFRDEFDAFMDFVSEGEWSNRDMRLPRDSSLTNADANAINFAWQTARLSYMPWIFIVASTGLYPVVRKA